MRVAVISDPHAQPAALRAVLAEIAEASVDQTWCLGDLVGYGPDPLGVIELVADHCDLALAGNHDLALTSRGSLDDFLGYGRDKLESHIPLVKQDPDAYDWLSRREPKLLAENPEALLVHASPVDPVWHMVTDGREANLCFYQLEQDHPGLAMTFVGHTHRPAIWIAEPGMIGGGIVGGPGVVELPDTAVIANPGAIGTKNLNDRRASWLIWDTDTRTLEWRLTMWR